MASPEDEPYDEPAAAEPEEFDPHSLGPDVPEIDIPSVDVETDTTFSATAEVPDELFRAFWSAAIFLNVAIAALSIGVMLVYFRGDYRTGGAAVGIGLLAAAFTARYYLSFKHRDRGDEE